MKVLIINKFLYRKGGAEAVALDMGELLRRHGHDVIFWGMKNAKNEPFEHSDLWVDEIDLNAAWNIRTWFRIVGKVLYSFEAKRKVRQLIMRTGKPDIVHVHNFAHQISPSILDVFKEQHIPVVMTMHDYKLVCSAYTLLAKGKLCSACAWGRHWNCFLAGCVKGSRLKSLLNTIEMLLHHKILGIYKNIAIFISPSLFLKDKVQAMGLKGPIEFLPNFVDVKDYLPQYEPTEKSICFVGRLSIEKGVMTLIKAVKGLDVTLKIIGEGPIKAVLENFVLTQQMTNVRFLGHGAGDFVKKEMASAMFIVAPSQWYENNSRSVIEALAMGKPVIGARIGGIPELVIDEETGYLFESGNEKDLKEKIERLAGDPVMMERMGRAGRVFVEQHLNADGYFEKLMKIYGKARQQ